MAARFKIAVSVDIIAENYDDAVQMLLDSLKSKLSNEETGFIGLVIYPENSIKVGK